MWRGSDSLSGTAYDPDLHLHLPLPGILLGCLQYLTQGILNYSIYLRSYLILLLTLTQRRDSSGQNKFQNIDLLLPYAVSDWRTGHGVGSCNPMQRKAVQCIEKQCNAMESNAMQWNVMQYSGMQCNTVECDAVECNVMQCYAIKCKARQGNGMISQGGGKSQKTIPSLS